MKININDNVFLPVYRPIIENYQNRYEIHVGGRASGKTVYCVQKLLLKGLKEKRFIVLMTKNSNKLKDSVWKELRDLITEWKLTEYFEFNLSELRATCRINGTEFKCLGLQEPERFKGLKDVSDVFMDEVSAFSQEDYELVDGTVRSKKYKLPLQIIAAANPVSKANWIYKYFKYDTGEDLPNTLKTHTTYKDNPYLDDSFLQRMEELKKKNYSRWLIEAEGEFANLDKLVFEGCFEVLDFDYRTLNQCQLICGLDWGFSSDPTAFVAALVDEETKELYIFKEFYKTNLTNPEIASMITSLGFSKSRIVCDSAEPKSIAELKKCQITRAIPAPKGRDSILFGINFLKEYTIYIHPECENTYTEFTNYSWQKDRSSGLFLEQPQDEFNHIIDALRYASSLIWKTNKLKTVSKSAIGF